MNILNDFIALFFPEYCFACQAPLVRGEKYLCTGCISALPRSTFDPAQDSIIRRRLANIQRLEFAFSFLKFIKGGKTQKIMHHLKYNNYPGIGIMLGRWFGHELKRMLPPCDVIVPVPLHQKKQRERGYNQSEKIAEGISETVGIPVGHDVAIRTVHSGTQTRKSRQERWKNVATIFQITDAEAVAGKHILIVDDIITTGATLEALALELQNAGVHKISVATLAMAE